MDDIIEKVISNSENLYKNNIGTDNEYIKFDLTKNMIESYFNNSDLLRCIGVQSGNGSTEGNAGLYRYNFSSTNTADQAYPQVSFSLNKNKINYDITREFNTTIPEEFVSEIKELHGIDPVKEIEHIMMYEGKAEFDRYLVNTLMKMTVESNQITSIDKNSSNEIILATLNVLANQIAINTRRGAANFCIASPRICSKLINDKTLAEDSGVGTLKKIGIINDEQQMLIRDSYAVHDYILLGYKGMNDYDAGLAFCPNMMFMINKTEDGLKCKSNFGICTDEQSKLFYKLILFK